MIRLYHGSYMSIPAPLTSVGRKELDFGPGFYVTRMREQAERWANRVCVIRAKTTPIFAANVVVPLPPFPEAIIIILLIGKYNFNI